MALPLPEGGGGGDFMPPPPETSELAFAPPVQDATELPRTEMALPQTSTATAIGAVIWLPLRMP